MTTEQILAILVFAVMFIAIIWGEVHRFIPALVGGAAASILILVLCIQGPRICGTCCTPGKVKWPLMRT